MKATVSARALAHTARVSASNRLFELAGTRPDLVAAAITKQPELANGLLDFDHLVEVMAQDLSAKEMLTQLVVSPVTGLSHRAKEVLKFKLAVAA